MRGDSSRECLGIEVDTNLPAARVLRVWDRIVARRGLPAELRMDKGKELVSVLRGDWAEKNGVALEFIQPGKSAQNLYIERFNKTYRVEVLGLLPVQLPYQSEGSYGELAAAGQRGVAP